MNSASLSVIQEIMPQGTSEVRHRHRKAQQFFFVLKGEASFEVCGDIFRIREHEGIHIPPLVYHQIKNVTGEDLEFIVISVPLTGKLGRIDNCNRMMRLGMYPIDFNFFS